MSSAHPLVIPLEFDPTPHSQEFVGAEHGDVPFSVMLVHSQPGVGPKVHRHPYAEVFVVESGEARFQLGADTVVVGEGHVVAGPRGVPHGFKKRKASRNARDAGGATVAHPPPRRRSGSPL